MRIDRPSGRALRRSEHDTDRPLLVSSGWLGAQAIPPPYFPQSYSCNRFQPRALLSVAKVTILQGTGRPRTRYLDWALCKPF